MIDIKSISKFLKRIAGYFIWFLLDPSKFVRIPTKFQKILIINLGFIGDLLATTPMISALKKKFNAKIFFMVRKGVEDVLTYNPEINKIITYKDNFKEGLKNIKKEKFDLAVIVWPTSFKICWLCVKGKIPYRIGTTQVGILEPEGFFLTRKVMPSLFLKHKVQENLDIARLIGADLRKPKIKFFIPKKDLSVIKKFLQKNKVKDYVVVHPGKRGRFYKEYSWPIRNFSKIIDFIIKNYGMKVIITGIEGEKSIANKIKFLSKNKNKIINAAGSFTLKQFGALIKKSNLVISIDSSPIHIASAFNIPVVVINMKYPKIWHPYMSKEKYKIIKNPKVNEVVRAIQKFLEK